jgi:hypothetical protein
VRDQVEAVATAADTSIAEQVRWRAEWLLALEPVDKPTLELMAAVARRIPVIDMARKSSCANSRACSSSMFAATTARLTAP